MPATTDSHMSPAEQNYSTNAGKSMMIHRPVTPCTKAPILLMYPVCFPVNVETVVSVRVAQSHAGEAQVLGVRARGACLSMGVRALAFLFIWLPIHHHHRLSGFEDPTITKLLYVQVIVHSAYINGVTGYFNPYTFHFVFRPGSENHVADWPSRSFDDTETPSSAANTIAVTDMFTSENNIPDTNSDDRLIAV